MTPAGMHLAGRFRVPAAHPCLPGHFPGRPVVPAVLLLDEAFALLEASHPGRRVDGVAAVKFARPVPPDTEVAVLHGAPAPADGHLSFACTAAGETVLRGTLRLSPAPGPAPA